MEVVRVCDVRGREYEEETTVELDSEAANLEHCKSYHLHVHVHVL